MQENEQTLCEDPLPLRKAKIIQVAALKKVTKARKLAEEKTAIAKAAAKTAADAAEVAAAAAKVVAHEAKLAAEAAFAEAEQQLEDLKA